MRPELVDRLRNACPQVWSGLGVEGTNMVFGVQVGDGWFEPLMNLSITLQIELNNFPEPHFRFLEVKEKNGRLVIQHEGSENDDIYKMIDTYCDESDAICELCGTHHHVQVRDLGDDVRKSLCINCLEPFERK